MMKLERLFFRHARAFARDQNRFPRDVERPLMIEGKAEFLKMALALKPRLKNVEKVITSPYLRCIETAQLLAGVLPGVSVVEEKAMSQDASLDEFVELFMGVRSPSPVIFVGHEPLLSRLVSFLLCPGSTESLVKMKKGAGCSLRWQNINEMGQKSGEVRWLVEPRLIHFL